MLLAIFNAVATPPPVLALGVLVVDDVLDCVAPLVVELVVPVVALAWDWVPALVVAVWCWVATLAVVEAVVEDCVAAAEDWRLAVVVAEDCCLADALDDCWVCALEAAEAVDCLGVVACAVDLAGAAAVVVALFCDCLAVVCPSGITSFWLM